MAHLIPFNKQFSSSVELVTLLRSRGLYIEEQKAEDYLDNIGYYRLSAYMNPLLKTPKTAHIFKNDATSTNTSTNTSTKVVMLYRFDKNVNAIYRNIKQNRIRKRIAKKFGLQMEAFESWMTVIAVTRNTNTLDVFHQNACHVAA